MPPIKNVVIAGVSTSPPPPDRTLMFNPNPPPHRQPATSAPPSSRPCTPTASLSPPSRASRLHPPPHSLLRAFANADAVISCLGPSGTLLQKQLIDAAAQAGVQRFIPSEFGWSRDVPLLPELAERLKGKGEVWEYLMEVCGRSEMSWSALATGPFLDWCITIVPTLGFHIPTHTARIFDSGNSPIACSTGAAIGQSVAGMLLHPDETKNCYLKIRSVEFTQNECLAALEEVTGEKWDVSHLSTKDIREGIKKKAGAKRFQEAFVDVISVQLFEEGAGRGVHVKEGDSDNELLGVKEEGLVEIMRSLVGK